jgi:hypothetical protein
MILKSGLSCNIGTANASSMIERFCPDGEENYKLKTELMDLIEFTKNKDEESINDLVH